MAWTTAHFSACDDRFVRFLQHADDYRGHAYDEARLRQEFVNPLFKALGWDMDNEQG